MSTSRKTLEIPSFAKINLFLDVVGRRPDGYHDLVTLFERVSLKDTVRLTEISEDEIVLTSRGEPVPTDGTNLAYQAADLIRRSRGIKTGVRIDIEKSIPVGAGLAGGSSNAASVLLGLNKLFGLKLDKKTLMSYANRLGSDVAFFIFNKPFAVGKARGGDLKAVSRQKKRILWHLLFSPPLKVLTKDVYGLLDREKKIKLTKKTPDVNILISCLKRNDPVLLNRHIYNRLSETVMRSYTSVSDLRRDLLKAGLRSVHMSGSGPTLFSVFLSRKDAENARKKLGRRLQDRCRIFLASTV